MNHTRFLYPRSASDTALPTNGDSFTLYETGHNEQSPTVQQLGFGRYIGHIFNSEAGTLKVQFWDPVAGTYRDIVSTACAATSTVANAVTCVVAMHQRIRILWVNTAVTQTVFQVNHGFTPDVSAIS